MMNATKLNSSIGDVFNNNFSAQKIISEKAVYYATLNVEARICLLL